MLPTDEQAENFRNMWSEHVTYHDETLHSPWKGPVSATVSADMADEVGQAMGFMGARVDSREEVAGGRVYLFSRGYYHHVGA